MEPGVGSEMETRKRAVIVVAIVAVLVFTSSLAYELSIRSGWPVQELGFTPVEDGFYQLTWNSKKELQLAYLGEYGSHYGLHYGQRIGEEWNITYLSRLFYEHYGASMALDSQDRVYICTHSYYPVDFTTLGPHILFATNSGGEWEIQTINVTGYCSAAEVVVDAQDRVHVFYSRDTHQAEYVRNSSIVDMVRTPEGWSSTVIKESNGTSCDYFYIDDIDRRPDGSIGMIYASYRISTYGWDLASPRHLNYSVISDGRFEDSTIIESLENYSGKRALSHDSSGNAYISAYKKNGDIYSLRCLTNAGGEWMSTDVAYAGNTKGYGTGTAITVGSDGAVYIGYFVGDYDGQTANHTVRYCSNVDGTWKVNILDDCEGWYMEESIALLTDEDRDMHIVYFQRETSESHGDRSVTVYTTSELDPDRYEQSFYNSSLRAALVSFIVGVVVFMVLRRQKTKREREEWMKTSGLFEDR